jgi:translation initiation factor IF-1
MANKDDIITLKGKVIERLPNASFRVTLETGSTIIAHSCGKIQKNRISIIVGDNVVVELSMYDLTKGRITLREMSNYVGGNKNTKNKKSSSNNRGKKPSSTGGNVAS